MASRKPIRKKSLFENPRYWYHISSTLTKRREYLTPWDNSKGFNRSSGEPDVKRTCVAPSVPHCFAAVPYYPGDKFSIYRTARKVRATPADDVWDAHITLEGWIQTPMMFVRVGTISLPHLAKTENVNIINEAASDNSLRQIGKVLAWWQRRKLSRYIKST